MSIKIIRLSKQFISVQETERAVKALHNINLDINEGSTTIFYGATGSGKTTLIQTVGGILRPTYGEVVLNSIHMSRAADREITRFREEYIGYIPQEILLIRVHEGDAKPYFVDEGDSQRAYIRIASGNAPATKRDLKRLG